MRKIVFIIPSASDSHYKNRITEFISNGYEVDVYAFEREGRKYNNTDLQKINIIGTLTNKNYISRISTYYNSFRKIWNIYKEENPIFYLGGLDIAMCFHLFNSHADYIFEECDLTHTYTKAKKIFELIDKQVIKNSLLTIFTSEGFIRYHFKKNTSNNICLVENKLNPEILSYGIDNKRQFNKDNLSIGFVGSPRFKSIFNFIDVFCREYPHYTFHIFGGPITERFKVLEKYKNCIFHGYFKNPDDLKYIYSTIDLVISTYDVKFDNVRYAEPNKLYESIYFETPIVVSSNTFLAEKVNRLGIGYDVDPLNEYEIINFIDKISLENYNSKLDRIKSINKESTLNINDHLFKKLKSLGV